MAKLDEAESSIVGGAILAARAAGDGARGASASSALARCLFWRGHYADARLALPAPDFAEGAPESALANVRLAARLLVGCGDLSGAMAAATEAITRTHGPGGGRTQHTEAGASMCTAALGDLAVGDLDAVARDVAGALAHARARPIRSAPFAPASSWPRPIAVEIGGGLPPWSSAACSSSARDCPHSCWRGAIWLTDCSSPRRRLR